MIPILIGTLEEDMMIYGGFKSRSLNGWLDVINVGLAGPQDKITNANEMSSILKKLKTFFKIERSYHYIPVGDDFREPIRKLKTFYRLTPKEK